MQSIIPGHARAYTLWLVASILVFGLYFIEEKMSVVYTALAFICAFFGDQATHLAQHHENPEQIPTWIERKMQKYHWLFRPLGGVLAVILILIALS